MVKGSALYVSEKKHGSWSKVWRGQIVLAVQSKAGGETDGAKNLMLLRRVEEDWTPIVLKTWESKTISGSLEAEVGGKQAKLGTFAPIKDKVCWQRKKTMIHWGLFPVGGKFEPWVIAPDILLASGYVRPHLMKNERFHL